MLRRDLALLLLAECRGDEIWSLEYCRQKRIPEEWLKAYRDTYESGFLHDRETIYVEDRVVNHYHGVRDFDLAVEMGKALGVRVDRILANHLTPTAIVKAIKEAAEEG